jgi:arylsulfatase A
VNGGVKDFPGRYGPDVCQEFVVDFIRRHKDQPFLVHYPLILTHGPHEPTPDSPDFGQSAAKPRKQKGNHFVDMVAYLDKLVGALDAELTTLGLRDNTLIVFTGDNGTGRGITSELADGSEQDGEKGSTTRGGMHVPLIVRWPSRTTGGRVCHDLVDMTDLFATLCEAAAVTPPNSLTLDGRSLLPQLRGEPGQPRDWIYSYWVPLRDSQTAHVGTRGAVEQAFDHRYKLYSTGQFYDLDEDVEETSPQTIASLTGESAAAAAKLQAALDSFRDARPATLAPPKTPGNKKRQKQ